MKLRIARKIILRRAGAKLLKSYWHYKRKTIKEASRVYRKAEQLVYKREFAFFKALETGKTPSDIRGFRKW
jgi:hypothetical protein